MMIVLKHRQENPILSESTSPQMDSPDSLSNSYQKSYYPVVEIGQLTVMGNAKDPELTKQFPRKLVVWNGFTPPSLKLLLQKPEESVIQLA